MSPTSAAAADPASPAQAMLPVTTGKEFPPRSNPTPNLGTGLPAKQHFKSFEGTENSGPAHAVPRFYPSICQILSKGLGFWF